MSTNVNPQATTEEILALLKELPPESLTVVEEFVRFLQEQSREGRTVTLGSKQTSQPPYLYPTVSLPATALDSLIGIMPPVGGDALSDSESLYDKA